MYLEEIDFLSLIEKGESDVVEFKKTTSVVREIIETVCAFANHNGGYIFIGINDDAHISGMQISDATLKNLANEIKLNTDPKIYPTISTVSLKGKNCILISIEESPLKPHLAYGKPFIRVASTNQKLDRDTYYTMLVNKLNGYGFDYYAQKNATLDDIDTHELYKFVDITNSVRNTNINTLLPPEIILQNLELVKDNKITRAALLLFGKNPSKFFSNNYEIKCGFFSDDMSYDHILIDKEYNDNLITNFSYAYAFVTNALKNETRKKSIQRKEKAEFPQSVIREAIVNMLVHRDYRQDIKSTIEIRPSSIKLTNPGHLFKPVITIEKLHKFHSSRPGNKLIAKIFYMLGMFENWGGGTLKIINETLKYSKPKPVFNFSDGMFSLTLLR
ncbi:MAG: putative DNA binding domain-containing protein [Bacteroidia bacterium]|nr:putative DNA binding domain-containing protein [Bacteroidia bacterium]